MGPAFITEFQPTPVEQWLRNMMTSVGTGTKGHLTYNKLVKYTVYAALPMLSLWGSASFYAKASSATAQVGPYRLH